jgi:hypothetical protein
MRERIDVRGASGAVYRFSLSQEDRPLSPMGGNFLYVRERGEGYEIILAGEGQNLQERARRRWSEAVEAHGASHLFTRLNIAEPVRRQEHGDIVAAARPVMNPLDEEPPT